MASSYQPLEQNTHSPHVTPRGTAKKALDINIDETKYGTFAEIGAGQEVARWFFHVGGAAGSVAKTMSAYDMVVSDAIYGESPRYVSRERLNAMLDHEYELLAQRLDAPRGHNTTFFIFADTVAARAHSGPEEGNGWMGIRFQHQPRSEPNQIDLHLRMLDSDNAAQQEALGLVGVNLVHAAFFQRGSTEQLLDALLDEIQPGRIEIDLVEFSGPVFEDVDHRLVSLQLVKLGLSRMAMFSPSGGILQPSEALYKKPILVERGTFQAVTHVHLDMLEQARAQFMALPQIEEGEVELLMEMTMNDLEETGGTNYDDFLLRADMLAATGVTVLVSNYLEHYRLVQYLRRLTSRLIGLVVGLDTLSRLYERDFYEDLPGGLLEAFGLMLGRSVRMYVYPLLNEERSALLTAEDLHPEPPLQHLHRYLLETGSIQDLPLDPPEHTAHEHLHIHPKDVLERLEAGDPAWQDMVPSAVADVLRASDRYAAAEVQQEA